MRSRAAIAIAIGFVVVSWLPACGSDDSKDSTAKNVCEKACDKIEECPGQQCVLNLENCDASTRAIAECVLAKPCAEMASCF